jgi:hypothetical protein
MSVIIKVPHSTWRQYNREELCAEFDISTNELARCAERGLVLQPPARRKGPPFNELDHLRLRTYKRCLQSGYGIEEVLDLIGRLHRRTAPIRTLILAKAYADEKLQELKSRMAGGDTLELINLRCDADILQAYIDDLTRLQSDEPEALTEEPDVAADAITAPGKRRPSVKKALSRLSERPSPPPIDTHDTTTTTPYKNQPLEQRAPATQAPPSAPKARVKQAPPAAQKGRAKQDPQLPPKARAKPKRTYPRTHGTLADESRQLWRRATPGGSFGWAVPVLLILAIIGGYIYLMPQTGVNLLSGNSAPEAPLDEETISSEKAIGTSPPPSGPQKTEQAIVLKASDSTSPTTAKATAKQSGTAKEVPLPAKAASDLEKIMAASGKTAAATGGSPRVIRINELVVFYDTQTRILRAKIELLKNLVADAPAVIGGRIFMVLRPMVGKNSQGTITLPRIPLSATDMADFFRYGVAFSLEDQKTTYLKTQLSKPPASQQLLSLYIFDNQQNLLLRETTSIEVKQTD